MFALPLPRLLTQNGPESHPTSYSQQVATALGLATSPRGRGSKGKYPDKDPIDECMEQRSQNNQPLDKNSSDKLDEHTKPLSKSQARRNRKKRAKAVVHNPGPEEDLKYQSFPEPSSTAHPDEEAVPNLPKSDPSSSNPVTEPSNPSHSYVEDAQGSIARLGRAKPAFAPWVELKTDEDWEMVDGEERDKKVTNEAIDKYIEKNARPMDRFSDDEEEGLGDWV
jgi:hypothetical protein